MATLSRMMKKAASSVFALAIRRTPPYGNYTSGIFTTPLKTSSTSIRSISTKSSTNLPFQVSRATSVSIQHLTSAPANKESNSNDTLLRNIQSEIDRIEEEFQIVPEAPREFPFNIVDNAAEQCIILTREYQNELLKVTICGYSRCLDMVVSVTKKCGSTLQFHATGDDTYGIDIDSWNIKNPNAPEDEGPYFRGLNEDLREDFYTYLDDRGIKHSITEFLCDYMDHREQKEDNDYKEEKEHILWFKKLKKFIKN